MTEGLNALDTILLEIGDFGRYQRRICFFISIFVIVCYFSSVIYVFETKPVKHRCEIEGCDVEPIQYMPDWWQNAIPANDEEPSKCYKFKRYNNSDIKSCNKSNFNQNLEEKCQTFIYETEDISIIHDYDLQCDENVWKLTLVGTIHSCGTIIGLPIFGILSDRFGRKTLIIYGAVLSGILGLTRSFSNSYIVHVVLEGFDAVFRSGIYPTIWILGSELVSPNKRVLVTLIFSTVYAVGGVIEGGLAWILQSWRTLLQIVYSLHLAMIAYYWLIPESTRWLLSRKRIDEAKDILKHVAKVNNRTVSEESLKSLDYEIEEIDRIEEKPNSVSELVGSRTLMIRLLNSAVCWICCCFLYNGLTVNSVQLSGNSYLDFILTMLVEIPGSIAYMIVDKVGRRLPLSGGFMITGVTCLSSIFVPTGLYWLKLCLYLLGKFGVSMSISVLYSVTTEVFPTPFRNTLLTICVMVGGFGLMAAPQMPLLETFWKPFPLLLFGCSGVLSSFLSLLYPETKGIELPNTIEEAENIGRKK